DDGDTIPTATELRDAERYSHDVDRDGIPNYLDVDSDGDGFTDDIDGDLDYNQNGVPDYLEAGAIAGGALCSATPGVTRAPLGALLPLGLLLSLLRSRRRLRDM